ncbi:hypothetical protein [Abyssalbus ytuae]|uniref:T9SS C-terminal target domain-containing protein n=1 Tax=Abyssalbus ytuae TaxID=2926907 RepID=A0A9E7CYY0_9FLAO|nr:hypothetical protein [Abyssalbus ytuae]UOB17095.1 hypothetical protein MQE35_15310 [Abyssalbus ytuae]
MKNLLKISAICMALFAFIFTACQKDEIASAENSSNALSGKEKVSEKSDVSIMAIIDLGLPGGPDTVDAEGNVFVNRDITLTAGNTYILHNYFRIQSGFSITIESGVHVEGARTGDSAGDLVASALVIERGAQIFAEGNVNEPIVFTSNKSSKFPGDWGGMVILGNAPVNIEADPTVPGTSNGVGAIEGLPTPNNTGLYGGNDPADNSGILRYVRIEYAGDIIGPANELNGLTLGGVGSGTTLEYIQVSFGLDDGYEFFGGTVNGKYLVANRNGDDDFDTDLGYSGKLQFGLSVRDQNGSWLADFPLNGNETNGDDDQNIPGNTNFTRAQLSNFTFIGPFVNNCSGVVNGNYSSGVYFRDDSDEDIFNSVIIGFPNGIRINDAGAANFNTTSSLVANMIDVRNTTIIVPPSAQSSPSRATLADNTGANFDSAFFTPALNNDIRTAIGCTGDNIVPGVNMAGVSGLNPNAWRGINNLQPDARPINNSGGLIGSASFTGLSGFDVVTYRGAFAPGVPSWLDGWTDWTF